jgi:hypothetical protein
MSDDPVFPVINNIAPEGERLVAEMRRWRLVRATKAACQRVERQMSYALRTRQAFRDYRGTGLHSDPAKVKANLLKRHNDARNTLLRIIVEEGGTEDAALDALSALLDENEEMSDNKRFRGITARLREHFKPSGFD